MSAELVPTYLREKYKIYNFVLTKIKEINLLYKEIKKKKKIKKNNTDAYLTQVILFKSMRFCSMVSEVYTLLKSKVAVCAGERSLGTFVPLNEVFLQRGAQFKRQAALFTEETLFISANKT